MNATESRCVYPIPKGWTLYSVDQIRAAEPHACVAGPFGSEISSKYFTTEGVPVIRGGNLRDDLTRFVPGGFAFVSEERARSYLPQHVGPNDLVFTCWGTIGQVGIIPKDGPYEEYIISNKQLKLRVSKELADPLFCFYYFGSPSYVQYVRNRGIGGAVPGINLGILKSLLIALPPLKIQKRIVAVLSAYDDLLENNRRRMALLEEASRQLYEEWFVRLRFPGHEHTPVIDGVPEGWTRKSLSDIAEFRLGKMLDQEKNRGELMPYLANVNVRWGEFDLRDLREMRFEHDELDTFGLKYGDIVMCEGGEPGRCAIWKEQLPGMMIQKAIHRIRCRKSTEHVYLYHSLRHQGQSGYLATLFTGATIKHLPREKLAKVKVDVPPPQLMELFLGQTGPMENQRKLLESANRRASEARDLLLPRLMSGEIQA